MGLPNLGGEPGMVYVSQNPPSTTKELGKETNLISNISSFPYLYKCHWLK